MRPEWIFMASLLLIGAASACATGSSAADGSGGSQPQDEMVGEAPEEMEPANRASGQSVSAEQFSKDDQQQSEASAGDESSSSDSARQSAKTDSKERGEARHTVDRDALLRLAERGPGWLLQRVTLEPVRRDDTFFGYRIADASESVRREMAPQLERGDVVKRVNGVELERPDDYVEAWSRLPRTDAVEIDFVRDGEAQTARWVVVEEGEDG